MTTELKVECDNSKAEVAPPQEPPEEPYIEVALGNGEAKQQGEEAEEQHDKPPSYQQISHVINANDGEKHLETATQNESNQNINPSALPEVINLSSTDVDVDLEQVEVKDLALTPIDNGNTSKKEKQGLIRHIVALLALSSIVLANMNRQAFNQALVSMARPINNSLVVNDALLVADSTTTPFSAEHTNTTFLPPPTTSTTDSQFSSYGYSTTLESDMLTTTTTTTTTSDYRGTATGDGDSVVYDDRFDWSGGQISFLQAAFSYGYTPFMIPGGRMSEIYGAKWVVFISGFGSALCCILSPFFADTNYKLLVASRVTMGLCQTGVSPALYALLTRWLPPNESSVYLPMIKVAVQIGFMSGSLVSAFFTWRVTFYTVGLIGLVWSTMWALVVTSDPSFHKLVSKPELEYIRKGISDLNKGRKQSMNTVRRASAPWWRIFTNPVVLAFMFAKFTVKLSTDASTIQIPMYLNNVFQMPQDMNGTMTSTNFAIQAIFTGLVAWMAKEFVVRKTWGLSKTGVRRLFQGICNFGMGFAYILITYNMSSVGVVWCAVILLSVTSMFGAGGEAVLPIDLSSEYSASIMAIANSSANLSGILLPALVSLVLANQLESSARWNLVWWIVGGIIMAGGLIFSCLVEAEIQDFSVPPLNKNKRRAHKNDSPSTAIEMKIRSQGRSPTNK